MTARPTRTYWFEVRETTVRPVRVEAASLAEARRLLDLWGKDSVGFTFKPVEAPQ